jgi:hypothetical protein
MISNRPHRGCVGGGWPTHSRVSNVWDTMDQLEAASLRLVVTTIRPQSDEKMHCAPTDSKGRPHSAHAAEQIDKRGTVHVIAALQPEGRN